MEFNGFLIWQRSGEITDRTNFYTWDILRSFIGKGVYWLVRSSSPRLDLPRGYRAYIVATEGAELDWLQDQSQKVSAPIFCINNILNFYGAFQNHESVFYLPWVDWHHQMRRMIDLFGAKVTKSIDKKISALSAMKRLNKAVTLAAVYTLFDEQDRIISHYDKSYRSIDEQFVKIDNYDMVSRYIDIYDRDLRHREITFDDFSRYRFADPSVENMQHSYDYLGAAYQECAINVTNESMFQSFHTGDQASYIIPGPHVTEKTLKCLVGETAFLNNGNFEMYKTLRRLGFQFDYGLDLSYDDVKEDYARLQGLISVLESIANMPAQDLFDQTRDSCQHNKDHIVSGRFADICETINQRTVEFIHSRI
jgi:hypothetical protein